LRHAKTAPGDINRVFPSSCGERGDFLGAILRNSPFCFFSVAEKLEGTVAVANSDPYVPLAGEDIDLDRVVMDPRYRRRVIERLRAEAAVGVPALSEPRQSTVRDD
jgi:hypothetical protein